MAVRYKLLAAVLAVAQAPYPANTSHPPPAWFVDVAAQAGVAMNNVNGDAATKKYIIETTGSGVAIIDYDHDGWPDIFLLNGTTLDGEPRKSRRPNKPPLSQQSRWNLYRRHARLRPRNPTAGRRVCASGTTTTMASTICTSPTTAKIASITTKATGHFKEVAEQQGVAGDGTKWGTGCSFVDYDRDGKLDLIVANYVQFDIKTIPKPGEGLMCVWKGVPVMCGPRGLPFTTNLLYHQLSAGRFRRRHASPAASTRRTATIASASQRSTTTRTAGPISTSPAIALPAFSIATIETGRSPMWRPMPPWLTAKMVANKRAWVPPSATTTTMAGPISSRLTFPMTPRRCISNNKDGTFTSTIFDAGLGLNTQYLGWGTMFLDVDNDGWPDILAANGHVYPEVDTAHLGSTYREPRILYWNQGNGKFKDISKTAGPGFQSRCPAADWPLPIYGTTGGSPQSSTTSTTSRIAGEHAATSNHWLGVILQGTSSNRDGIGAQRHVSTADRDSCRKSVADRVTFRAATCDYISAWERLPKSIVLRSNGPAGLESRLPRRQSTTLSP